MPSNKTKSPNVDGADRAVQSLNRRIASAQINSNRIYPSSQSNGEESHHGMIPVSNFSKGLDHDQYGLASADDYEKFVNALTNITDSKVKGVIKFNVPGPYQTAVKNGNSDQYRQWESPLAGLYYNIEGPDPAAVAIAAAPKLGSDELIAEIAEVYALALTRDIPFDKLSNASTKLTITKPDGTCLDLINPVNKKPATLGDLRDELAGLGFLDPTNPNIEDGRQKARFDEGTYNVDSIFRGSAPGAKAGPILSQFLLIGTKIRGDTSIKPKDGIIQFGAQTISQKVCVSTPGLDFMTQWDSWLEIQNAKKITPPNNYFTNKKRLIETPRDLATYVHYDQLYQAYFNACLIMLENGVPFSTGFPNADSSSSRGAFASFGGPHVLSLMTEVASRVYTPVK